MLFSLGAAFLGAFLDIFFEHKFSPPPFFSLLSPASRFAFPLSLSLCLCCCCINNRTLLFSFINLLQTPQLRDRQTELAMSPLMSLLIFFTFVILVHGKKDIEDPFNIFCGSTDCYDVLNLTRADTNVKEIKKAYRKLSLQYHPDKNKEETAEAVFLAIAKASEVLSDPEQKELYDYYLDHPRVLFPELTNC